MPTGENQKSVRPSRQNLFRVWLIRSILVVALLATLLILKQRGGVDLPWYPLAAVLVTMVLINLALLLRLKPAWPVSEAEFFANLLLDILFLTLVLYLTGGSTNPLVSYYLIPLIISAAVLRPRFTWSIALLTIACYTLLFFHFRPLDLFAQPGHGDMMGAHFLGMWINFAFSALLISWFVVRMAATMREQEQMMAEAREEGLRDEQIISVASIAAGTAHELRTPLATMTVLVDEMKNEQPGMAEELATMQGQLERCDSILKELISTTTDSSRRHVAVAAHLISEIQEKWDIARPEIGLEVELSESCAKQEICYDLSLHHALLNFLHNAADASPGRVRLAGSLDAGTGVEWVLLAIEDRGPGVPPEIADWLGRNYISRKEGGLGLGVLLSSASIERLGGQVKLMNRPGGGTRLEIRLPVYQPEGVESHAEGASFME